MTTVAEQDLTPYGGVEANAAWVEEVRALAKQRDAVLLAHKNKAQAVKELVKRLAESKEYKKLV